MFHEVKCKSVNIVFPVWFSFKNVFVSVRVRVVLYVLVYVHVCMYACVSLRVQIREIRTVDVDEEENKAYFDLPCT